MSFAGGSAPPFEPDPGATGYGSLAFYDSAGNQVTSGTGDLSSPFAYVVASTAADTNAKIATVYFANPQKGVATGLWVTTNEAASQFSPASDLPSGTPADVKALAPTDPVAATSAANITSWLAANASGLDTNPGYAMTIQVRLQDSGGGGAGNLGSLTYWRTDIGYNTSSSPTTVDGTTVPANGWAVLYPILADNYTTLTTSATGGNLILNSPITLTASVAPTTVSGSVQFFDNGTLLNTSTTPGSGTYTYTYTPTATGTQDYSATFLPTSGSGSSATGVTVQVITGQPPTITEISPTPLGQGASSIPISITGTGFLAGATVSVAGSNFSSSGVSFSSVSVVDSTTLTAKATVSSYTKVGPATVTVADSAGSGSCTTCLSIVAAPSVKSIWPPSLIGASKSVTITGASFASGAILTGPNRVTFSKVKVVSSTKITAVEKVASGAKAGKHQPITVANGVLGGDGRGSSNVLTIFAAPTVKSIVPSSLKPGASKAVTITGTGFESGATVTGPTRVKFSRVKVVSSTKITATVKVASNAKAAKHLSVTVINGIGDGGGRGTGKVLTIT
ncbi:MAG: Ig-like domain repeat protein [Acidimicrobiales bacterium]